MGFITEKRNGICYLKKYVEEEGVTDVVVPKGINVIEKCAFEHCNNITSITFGNDVEDLDIAACVYCDNLKKVVFGNKVKYMMTEFRWCPELTEIVISDELLYEYGLYLRLTPWMNNLKNDWLIVNGKLIRYTGKEKNISIPDTVQIIEHKAFAGNSYIESVIIPESVTTIGSEVFLHCINLREATLCSSVKETGHKMFDECYKLKKVVIPEGVEKIDTCCFRECLSLTDIVLPKSLKIIGDYSFTRCRSLSSLMIPDGVIEIGNLAFAGTDSLTDVYIPDSVKTMGCEVFIDTDNKRVSIHTDIEDEYISRIFRRSRIRELTVRGKFSADDLFKKINYFSDSAFNMIIATEIPAEYFSNLEGANNNLLIPACRGFAKAYLSEEQIFDEIKESYFKAIKENARRFFEKGYGDDYVWKLMITEKLMEHEDRVWLEFTVPYSSGPYEEDVWFFFRDCDKDEF